MGPLLFIIYVNDITAASDIFNCTMYADDTTLSTSINCSENYNNCDLINSELSKINEWLIVNKLSLNATKKKSARLIIANQEIESVEQFNFLGITLDHHLNWNAHVDKLASKISRNITKIKKFSSRLYSKNIIYISNFMSLKLRHSSLGPHLYSHF